MEIKRAYAIGAVIINDDGKAQVKYHPQCIKCGHVMIGITLTAFVSMGSRTNQGVFHCSKCGAEISVQINRGV